MELDLTGMVLSLFWQQKVRCDAYSSLVGIGFEMVSFLEFKFEFWRENTSTTEHNMSDEKLIVAWGSNFDSYD